MGMDAPIHMNMSPPHMHTDRDILTLAQWLSPAFPIGAFAYSHGLEQAIQSGRIETPDGLQNWLADVVQHGSGINDCILLRAAYASSSAEELEQINQTAFAFMASSERRLEAELQGAAFCKTAASIWGATLQDLSYPVAVGRAAAHLSIDVQLTAAMYLHAVLSNLISAAMRLMPLGQTDGQRILAELTALCENIAADSAAHCLNDLSSSAFLSDIMAMQHETLQPRIFRS